MKRMTNRLMALGMAGCLALAALAGCSAPAQEPAPEPAPEPEPSNEEKLLTEIRDLLKEK